MARVQQRIAEGAITVITTIGTDRPLKSPDR